uniref:Uncharacterized protein n=1 Tax=Rhizophora mucronata TaxID=61149 RepID=A0A2P2N760_RHIMU
MFPLYLDFFPDGKKISWKGKASKVYKEKEELIMTKIKNTL